MYPCIEIKVDGIVHNINILKKACDERGIFISLVTKVLAGDSSLVNEIISKSDIKNICDSRLQNLIKFKDIDVEKWLIRSPMLSEVDDVVEYVDVSLNTEKEVLLALNEAALNKCTVHKVILMAEGGDLREGCYMSELIQLVDMCNELPGILVIGIGTNLSCLNEVVPTKENMADFVSNVNLLEGYIDKMFPVISGGASSSIPLLMSGDLDKRINNLRFGEAVYLGNIPVYDESFSGAKTDNFILKAEIIELKAKPEDVNEEIDSAKFIDRAIVAIGKQDIYLPGLFCVDEKMRIVGGSSDHVVLDVTDCDKAYRVGDIVEFKMNYNCLLNAMTSSYIKKRIL